MGLYEATVQYANGEIGTIVCENAEGKDVMRCQHNCDRSGICPHRIGNNGCDLDGITVLDVKPYKRIEKDQINIDGAFNLATAIFAVMLRDYKNGDDEYKEQIMQEVADNPIFCMATGKDIETLQHMIKKQAAKEA